MRLIHALIVAALLGGCVGPPAGKRPRTGAPATSPETRQCLNDLTRLGARFGVLADQDMGNGCRISGALTLLEIGVPITNIRAIRCPMARTLALWMRDSVQPAARAQLGTRVIRIESFGAYACRRVIGVPSTKLSEHAQANAVDIAAFVLADGRRISVDGGWKGAPDAQRFLRDVRSGACARFATVLSPDFNAAHANHLHFDLGRGPFCR